MLHELHGTVLKICPRVEICIVQVSSSLILTVLNPKKNNTETLSHANNFLNSYALTGRSNDVDQTSHMLTVATRELFGDLDRSVNAVSPTQFWMVSFLWTPHLKCFLLVLIISVPCLIIKFGSF